MARTILFVTVCLIGGILDVKSTAVVRHNAWKGTPPMKGLCHRSNGHVHSPPRGCRQGKEERLSSFAVQQSHRSRLLLRARKPNTMEEEMKGAKVGVDTTETSKRSGQLTIVKYVALMGLAGALLGPWLDNYHGLFGTLNYNLYPFQLRLNEHEILKSALWVPFLFGVAGVIIGYLGGNVNLKNDRMTRNMHIFIRSIKIHTPMLLFVPKITMPSIGALYVWLDTALQDYSRSSTVSPQSLKAATSFNQFLTEGGNKILPPTIDSVLYCISLFSAQYYLSGLLDSSGCPLVLSHVILAAVAIWGFYKFDNSLAGLLASLATAMGGPAIEIGLVNVLHAYSYSNADLWGVDSWIPWVYFLGGPAVGNLGRLTWHELNK